MAQLNNQLNLKEKTFDKTKFDDKVDEQKEYLIKKLFENINVPFDEIYNELNDKLKIVCVFIAMLQLALEGFLTITVTPEDICNFTLHKTNQTQN